MYLRGHPLSFFFSLFFFSPLVHFEIDRYYAYLCDKPAPVRVFTVFFPTIMGKSVIPCSPKCTFKTAT